MVNILFNRIKIKNAINFLDIILQKINYIISNIKVFNVILFAYINFKRYYNKRY